MLKDKRFLWIAVIALVVLVGSYSYQTGLPPTQNEISDYMTAEEIESLIEQKLVSAAVSIPSGSGVSDHGELTGLSDDDHPQYQTNELTSSGLADHANSGSTITGTAGEALAIGNLVYLDSDGKYYLTDANSSTTMFCTGVSTETISLDSTGKILVEGYLRDDSWSGWTVGSESPLYVSWNAGEITQTLPNSSGDQVQIIGYPIAGKIIRFDPDSTVVEIS